LSKKKKTHYTISYKVQKKKIKKKKNKIKKKKKTHYTISYKVKKKNIKKKKISIKKIFGEIAALLSPF